MPKKKVTCEDFQKEKSTSCRVVSLTLLSLSILLNQISFRQKNAEAESTGSLTL